MLLERKTSLTGVVYYTSPQLEKAGIAHAFSTRLGGISPRPFDSMNLGNPNGCAIQDENPRITENYRLLMHAIGCEDLPRFYLHQIHGSIVKVVEDSDFSCSQKGDALLTAQPARVLSVRIADCCPILLGGPGGQAVAAIHAGWRGAVGEVIAQTVAKLCEIASIAPGSLIAAIGPCIGFDAFEVGPEVLIQFETVFGEQAPIRRNSNSKGHVDLAAACRIQLLRSGVRGDRIDTTDRCTHRDADEFFSHRRDRGITGRMSALIASGRK